MVSADTRDDSQEDFVQTLKRVGKSPATEQILVGGASGWAAGFVFIRFGRQAAIGIGTTVLVLQIAVHRRYVTIDWKNLQGTSQAAREKLEKVMHGEPSATLLATKHFIQNNAYFLIAFSAGFLIGLGMG